MIMKYYFKLVLVGAIVLTAAACAREPLAPEETQAQAETGVKEVTTQFVLNVASAPSTKMTTDVVQLNGNFRGIQNAKLFVYNTGLADASKTPYVLVLQDWDAEKSKEYDLSDLMTASYLDNSGDKNDEESSRRVLQLSIPVGVDAVLLYGKAIKPESSTAAQTVQYDAQYGCTYDYDYKDANKPSTLLINPSQTEFYAHPMLDAATQPKYNATADLMIAVINDILSVQVDAAPGETEFGSDGAKITFSNLPAVSWAQYGHRYELDKEPTSTRYGIGGTAYSGVEVLNHEINPGLEEILGKSYYLFTYIKPLNYPEGVTTREQWETWAAENPNKIGEYSHLGEYRAGSSFAMKRMIADLYHVITAAKKAVPTTAEEANAARLADVIITKATSYFNESDGSYKSLSVVKTLLGSSWKEAYNLVTDLNNYPGQFNVPEGAAQLGFHAQATDNGQGGTYQEDEFFYYHPNQPLVNPLMQSFEPRKYLYPAELWYYVNSPIRTTSIEVTDDSYPNGVTHWNDESATSKWATGSWASPGKVTSSTRGVAVTNSLNYGVALLKSVVSVKSGVTFLLDNRKKMTDESTDREINVNSADITLTGVLIGGVNPRMNWQFVRKYPSGEFSAFDGVIYDSQIGDLTSSKDIKSTVTNYTLVYDNYNSDYSGDADAAAAQNDVYVSLQFKNGGDPFWGRDNMIPKGGTFYLVAKLPKPTAGQIEDLKWPTDHQIPPVDAVGVSKKVARVFIQDFVTTANFTLDANSLKHAYYSVPDLRASNMSLGISVDLQWTAGLEYNYTL